MLLNTPGKRIERLRKDRKWTQADLANASNVQQSYISYIENDGAKPSAEIMKRLAIALGVSLDFIMVMPVYTPLANEPDSVLELA